MTFTPRAIAVACGVAIAFALSGAHAAATMYKWVDKDGRVFYSDEPPPANVKAEILKPPPPPSNPNAAQELADKQLDQKQREKKQQDALTTAQKERVELERRRENCVKARAQLRAMLEQGDQLLYGADEKGQRIVLDDAAKRAAIESQQIFIRDACQ